MLTESLELVVDDLFGCSTRELDRQREEKSLTHTETDRHGSTPIQNNSLEFQVRLLFRWAANETFSK